MHSILHHLQSWLTEHVFHVINSAVHNLEYSRHILDLSRLGGLDL